MSSTAGFHPFRIPRASCRHGKGSKKIGRDGRPCQLCTSIMTAETNYWSRLMVSLSCGVRPRAHRRPRSCSTISHHLLNALNPVFRFALTSCRCSYPVISLKRERGRWFLRREAGRGTRGLEPGRQPITVMDNHTTSPDHEHGPSSLDLLDAR